MYRKFSVAQELVGSPQVHPAGVSAVADREAIEDKQAKSAKITRQGKRIQFSLKLPTYKYRLWITLRRGDFPCFLSGMSRNPA
jgi:hypothetical protein